MSDKKKIVCLSRRVSESRARLLVKFPFFGRLILRLKLRFSECGTACTDMENIIFDPDFLEKLSDTELDFVLFHEVMHCVLKHCTRGLGKLPFIYNIACDIVVNSFVMETLGFADFTIAGEKVIHLLPDNTEGRDHTAEEVYNLLVKLNVEDFSDYTGFDSHTIWAEIFTAEAEEKWGKFVRDSATAGSGTGSAIPYGMRRYIKEVVHTPKTNWRQLLNDYIRFDLSDYTFEVPDKRYSDDIIMPSFLENRCGEVVKKLWIFVDTSGSVDDEGLSVAMQEIYEAYSQIDNISGKILFFDYEVSEPFGFENLDELKNAKPVGGGGTSFKAVFDYLSGLEDEDIPNLVIILTDGYAEFPQEGEAMGIPVVWIIINSKVAPPWGETVYIDK